MIEIILGFLLVLAAIERFLLILRHDQERAQERTSARQERAELVARVQGLSWRPEPRETPTEDLVEEPDEIGMVGRVLEGKRSE